MRCLPVVCVMSTVLVAACGDNLSPDPGVDDDDSVTVDDDGDVAVDTGESESGGKQPPREIRALIDLNGTVDCDAATANFEVWAVYADNSESVPRLRCHVTFDDGATSDSCGGAHTFAAPGMHSFTFEVLDLDTGATAHVVRTREVLPPFGLELALDVPECGLEVGFTATPNASALIHVVMSPLDKVVVPHIMGRTGRFEALEPGTYTITAQAEDERPVGPICVREVSRTVELRACKDC